MKIWRAMILSVVVLGCQLAGMAASKESKGNEAYVFTSFRGNGEDGLHLAYSRDGLQWTAIKGDKTFLKPLVGGKLMRDPCIIQGPDGLFHMVWTSSWRDKGIGIAHSKDLIKWTEQKFVPVMKHEPTARNCWAPEITWDPDGKQYVIYWATTITRLGEGPKKLLGHRMYCTTTKDFKEYSKARLFLEPGFNVIDSTIIRDGGKFIMILKDERKSGKNLRIATSDKVTGPWSKASDPFSPKGLWVEGPTCLKRGDFWYVYYDAYRKHRYGAMRTKDFKTWENVTDKLKVPKGMRHGTVLTVSGDVLDKLLKAAGSPGDAGRRFEGPLQAFLGKPRMEIQQLFDRERHPNVVVTIEGTVLATLGNKSLRARRSEDGGKTWGKEIIVAKPGFQGGGLTVDETTGDILAFAEEHHPPAPVSVYRSRDDGKTWRKMAVKIHPDSRGNVPSMHMNEHGITLRHGKHAGRLIRAARHYGKANYPRKHWPTHYTTAIYSDDHGKTWKTSKPFAEMGTGEAAIAELSDGRLYYNSRSHWNAKKPPMRRRCAWSADGGETWTGWRIVQILPDGPQDRSYGCFGGLVRLPIKGRDILLYSNCDSPRRRNHGTVWASFDGGKTWPLKRLVRKGSYEYSSLTAGRPGTASEGWIYLHFEGLVPKDSHIARFNLSWVMEGKPTGDGAIPRKADTNLPIAFVGKWDPYAAYDKKITDRIVMKPRPDCGSCHAKASLSGSRLHLVVNHGNKDDEWTIEGKGDGRAMVFEKGKIRLVLKDGKLTGKFTGKMHANIELTAVSADKDGK